MALGIRQVREERVNTTNRIGGVHPGGRAFGINNVDRGICGDDDDVDVWLREGLLTDVTGDDLLFLIGIVPIGRGGLMKYPECTPVGPVENRLVSATTLRNAGLLIASRGFEPGLRRIGGRSWVSFALR